MSVSDSYTSASVLMQTLLRHMESLKRSVDGDELYALIAGTLRRYGQDGQLGPEGVTHLYRQLDAYAKDPLTMPAMRIRTRLLQQHLVHHLPEAFVEATRQDLDRTAPPPERPYRPPPGGGMSTADGLAEEEARAAARRHAEDTEAPLEGVLEHARKNGNDDLAERKERYQTLLRSEQDAWKAIYDTVKDFSRLKQLWMESLNELAQERDALAQKLDRTTEYLKTAEHLHSEMRTELEKLRREGVRRPRLPGAPRARGKAARKVTSMPVRPEDFLRQLETEVKRNRRTGRPFALAMLGIEHLETLASEYGAEGEEAVLRCYTHEVLSNFRAYDQVTVYGKGRFAILFPDSEKDGAVRALEKARKRAAETPIKLGGRSLALPGFVTALGLYTAGEEAAVLLARVEAALDEALLKGEQKLVQL